MNSLNEWFWALGTLWGQNKVPVLMWHMYQYRETVKSKIMGHVRCGKLQVSLFCIKLNLSRTPEVGREQVHPEPLCFRMREKGVQRPCSWQVSSDLNSNLEASVFGTDWSEMSAVRRLKGVHDVAFLDQDFELLFWLGLEATGEFGQWQEPLAFESASEFASQPCHLQTDFSFIKRGLFIFNLKGYVMRKSNSSSTTTRIRSYWYLLEREAGCEWTMTGRVRAVEHER